jgi:hypothetical protein
MGRTNLVIFLVCVLLVSTTTTFDWVLSLVQVLRGDRIPKPTQSVAVDAVILLAGGLVCLVIVGLFESLKDKGRDDH